MKSFLKFKVYYCYNKLCFCSLVVKLSVAKIKVLCLLLNYNLRHVFVGDIRARMEGLQHELTDLRVRRHQQELEIANIENYALRQRFQDILDNLLQEQLDKEQEVSFKLLILSGLYDIFLSWLTSFLFEYKAC